VAGGQREPKSRRLGKFEISKRMLDLAIGNENSELLGVLMLVFSNFIILDANYKYENDTIEYLAYCPKFKLVRPGGAVPSYTVEVISKGRGRYEIKIR